MDAVVEIRDAARVRRGQLGDATTFVCSPRKNDVGVWSVSLPAEILKDDGTTVANPVAEQLRAPGAGIIATFPGGRIVSGPMEFALLRENTDDPGGTWDITGVTDLDLLAREPAYPQPSNDSPGTQTVETDYRAGAAETIMRAYVNANVGPSAPVSRRIAGLTLAADLARGGAAEGSPRFTYLLELLQSIANARGLLFDLVQVGTNLEFRVWEPENVSTLVRMDVANDELAETESAYGAPQTTEVLVLGRGLDAKRTVIRRTSTASLAAAALWGRRRVRVIDLRSTDSVTELQQAADDELATNGDTIRSLVVTPSDQGSYEVGVDWWLGSLVTVNVAGQDVVAEVVEVRASLTPEGWLAGATVGNIAGYDPDAVMESRVSGVEQRVGNLERNSGPLPARLSAEGQQVTDWNSAIESGFYWARSAANGPTAWDGGSGAWMTGVVRYHPGSGAGDYRITQELREARTNQDPVLYTRYWNNVTWTPWVAVIGGDSGWTTSGLSITAGTGWSLNGYRLRKIGNRVTGHVTVTRTGAALTAASGNGDLSDVPMATMPTGWRNGEGYDKQLVSARSGISMWHSVALTSGALNLVGGMPGVTLPTNDSIRVVIDYLTD